MSLKNRVIKIVGLVLVLLLVTGGAGLLTFKFMVDEKTQVIDKESKASTNDNLENKINILLLGSDSKYQSQSRSDTLMVVSLDLNTKKVGVISLPRDTRVEIPGRDGYHKINAAYSYGGVELLKETTEELLKIPIDYHLQIDYQGFVEMIDTLGGVEVTINKDLKYVDQADGLYINLVAGKNRLTGEQALGYVRFRHDALGDIGRIERQQKFLRAVIKHILNPKIVFKLPELIKEFNANVNTDLDLTKMLQMTSLVKDFSLDQIEMEMLPGEPRYIDGISYWLPHVEETRLLVNSLIRNKSYLNHKDLKLIILNGNGRAGIAQEVAKLLARQGYGIEEIGNADNFDYSKSVIISPVDQAAKLKKLTQYLNGELIIQEDSSKIKVIIGHNTASIREKQGFLS